MAALFVQKRNQGKYGQVEPNRLTGITYGNLESQAPAFVAPGANADAELTPIAELENGQFLCVVPDITGSSPMGRIAVLPENAPPTAKPFLVFSERKVYDERHGAAHFVDLAMDKVDGLLYPRLIGLEPDSDIFTTNTIGVALAGTEAEVAAGNGTIPASITVGTVLYIGDDGYLSLTPGRNTTYQFVITKVYTMPDGQPGVKLMSQAFVAA